MEWEAAHVIQDEFGPIFVAVPKKFAAPVICSVCAASMPTGFVLYDMHEDTIGLSELQSCSLKCAQQNAQSIIDADFA